MIRVGIRARVLLAALLPVALLAGALATFFLVGRMDDLEAAQRSRSWALAHQVASASEYGIFSGNREALHNLVLAAKREADVRGVTIFDAADNVLARAGETGNLFLPAASAEPGEFTDAESRTRLLLQPIYGSAVPLDDLFEQTANQGPAQPPLLGRLALEISLDSVLLRQRELMLAGILMTLASLAFGVVLAVYLSSGVIHPIVAVSEVVERIGSGDLSARVPENSNDVLKSLRTGVNEMATRIQAGQYELQQRIAEATAELRQKKEEAELATLAKSRFLASASHDLRQPMHALGLFVGRLLQLPHDDESRHLIGRVDAAVQALQNLLDALLDISRLEAGVMRTRTRHFPVAELFERLRADSAETAAQKGLQLRLRPCPLWLASDPLLLHRILLNLVSNALRYTRQGGVLVAGRRRGEHLRIEVWDTGVGIPPESQAEIFREFVQLSHSERERGQGLGLGLAIVERTARLLGHPLSLHSRLGSGSCFAVEVPLAPSAEVEAEGLAAPQHQFDGISVLVIDDEEIARQSLSSLLQSWGCRVYEAADAVEAQSLFAHTGQVDLVACDYRLGQGANGIDALAELRLRTGLACPAFLISGDTSPQLAQLAAAAGITLLQKPVRAGRLRALMAQLLHPPEEEEPPSQPPSQGGR